MVARSPIAGIRYRNNPATDSPGIVPATTEMVEDLDLTTVPWFATTADRDAAYANAIAGTGVYLVGGVASPRKGLHCTVGTPAVPYMWNGTSWVQDNNRRVFYQGDATPTIPVGLHSVEGFPSAGGFIGNANGIVVPEAGVYVVHYLCTNLSATITNPLTNLRIGNSLAAIGRFTVGSVSTECSWIAALVANNQINIFFHNQEAGTLGTALRFTITKVSA